jgi:hypothetical protein
VSLNGIERIEVNAGSGTDTLNYSALPESVLYNAGGFSSDILNVNSGTYTFNAEVIPNSANLTVNVAPGAAAVFNSTVHLAGLNVNGTATVSPGGSKVLVTKALSVPGTLDLADNKLIYNYTGASPLATIFDRVASGRNGGSWDGGGIQSSVAGGSGRRGLGLAEASEVLNFNGGTTAVWSGLTVDNTSLLIRYTHQGDLDLNGRIDGDDYFRIDGGFAVQASGYASGDIDYNGKIDSDDYFRIDANYGLGQSQIP